jgi:hypothetical protein
VLYENSTAIGCGALKCTQIKLLKNVRNTNSEERVAINSSCFSAMGKRASFHELHTRNRTLYQWIYYLENYGQYIVEIAFVSKKIIKRRYCISNAFI